MMQKTDEIKKSSIHNKKNSIKKLIKIIKHLYKNNECLILSNEDLFIYIFIYFLFILLLVSLKNVIKYLKLDKNFNLLIILIVHFIRQYLNNINN